VADKSGEGVPAEGISSVFRHINNLLEGVYSYHYCRVSHLLVADSGVPVEKKTRGTKKEHSQAPPSRRRDALSAFVSLRVILRGIQGVGGISVLVDDERTTVRHR
jgi:hypothetical protein